MVRKALRTLRNAVVKTAGRSWSAARKFYKFVIRFLGWNVKQVRRVDRRLIGLAGTLGREVKYTPGFTSSFWKAYWAGIQELFTLKYWLKWFFRLMLCTLVVLALLTALGALMSMPLPDIKLPTSRGFVSPVFTPEVRRWTPLIMWWSAKYGVDPNAAATIMQIESCGDPQAVSIAGAQGLFQVMPFHFAEGENMTDPETNAMRGLTYFRLRLQASEGDYKTAFATYHGGPGAFAFSNRSVTTNYYADLATGIYEDAKSGKSESPTLQSWLERGGASFCSRAAKFPVQILNLPDSIRLVEPDEQGGNRLFEGAEAIVAEALERVRQVAPPLEKTPSRLILALLPHMRAENACDGRGLPLDNAISGYVFHDNGNPAHAGIDIGADAGELIPTTIAGTAVAAQWDYTGYGNLVIVSNGPVQTYYAHLSEMTVRYGDQVQQGDIIGKAGSTGNSTGTHLHYEVRSNWVAIDPLSPLAYTLTCASGK